MSARSLVLESLAARDRISPENVRTARQVLFADGLISPDEADALFQINDAVTEACPEWRMLFVEALTDYLVRQQEPPGHVDADKADWLMARIDADGLVRGATELELVIHVLETASEAPAALSLYALRQAADAARAADDQGGGMTVGNVARIRRALYAMAGDGGGASVSRDEAEVLFDLNDAIRGRRHDADWTDLFAKAIGAAIMQASGYRSPPRAAAARQEAWLKAPNPGIGGVLAGALRGLLNGGLKANIGAELDNPDALVEAHCAEIEALAGDAALVNEEEAQWLASRIGRDGDLDQNERALLRFLKTEAPDIHPALQPLLAAA